MKKIKKFWKKHKTTVFVELLVIVVMLGFWTTTYQMTYELEYQKVKNVEEHILKLDYFEYESDKKVSDFLIYLNTHLLCSPSVYDSSRCNDFCGYSFAWEVYDKEDNILERSTDNDFMIIWSPERDGKNEESYDEEVYLVEKYFTEDEMKGFWEFYLNRGDTTSSGILIDKVVGYYNAKNEYAPVEIVFRNATEEGGTETNTYSLKSNENSNIEGIDYVTRKGDSEYVDNLKVDEEGTFWLPVFQKRLDSAVEKVKKAYDTIKAGKYIKNTDEDVYYYWFSFDNELSKVKPGEVKEIEIILCADLKYMIHTNDNFKQLIIIEFIFCQIVGLLIMYIINKSEKRRRYLDSMKYTFINAMAHEMKTPAAVIMNSAECIKDGIHPEKQSNYLDKVKKEAIHMNRLLLDMLTYTKVSDDERKLYKEKVNLRELLEEVCVLYVDSMEKKNIKLQWDVKSENVIMADRKLMEMVIDNYLSNAVKYCKQSGVIKISLDERHIFVYNDGQKIHPTKLNIIWEPLYVTDASRKNREGSSGMGLAISAKILDLHGMKYGAKNVNDGVEFYITTR